MIEHIQELIHTRAAQFKGDIGVGFKDLKTGAEVFYNGDRKVYMASTFKTFLLIAFLDLVMKGKLREDEIYTLKPEDYLSSGSTLVNKLYPRREFALIELATLMMILSDNTSTDILWKIVGAGEVKRILDEIGLEHTTITKNCNTIINGYYGILEGDPPEEVERKFREWKFQTAVTDKDNVSIPRDVVYALDLLYKGKILNPEYCRKALDIMSICILNARIPSFLPGMGASVAHKTGTIDGWVNDVGIVYTPKGDYVLVFYSNSEPWGGIPRSTYGENFLATLSREIYDAYVEG
jgi:beta-lactamase class A